MKQENGSSFKEIMIYHKRSNWLWINGENRANPDQNYGWWMCFGGTGAVKLQE
jgi:hypothetical protein